MTTKDIKFIDTLLRHVRDVDQIICVAEGKDYDMKTFADVPNGWGKEKVDKGFYVYGSALDSDIFLQFPCTISFPLSDTDEQLYYWDTDNIVERF